LAFFESRLPDYPGHLLPRNHPGSHHFAARQPADPITVEAMLAELAQIVPIRRRSRLSASIPPGLSEPGAVATYLDHLHRELALAAPHLRLPLAVDGARATGLARGRRRCAPPGR